MYSRLAVLDLGSAALTDDFDLIPGLVYTDMISPVHEQVAWAEDDSNLFVAWHNATQASEVYEAFTGKAVDVYRATYSGLM